jgi:hypothetical protein
MKKILVLAVLLPLAACQGTARTAPAASAGCGTRHGCGTQDLAGGSPKPPPSATAACGDRHGCGTQDLAGPDQRCPAAAPAPAPDPDLRSVLMTDRLPWPTVTLAVGQTVTARVTGTAQVTALAAAKPAVACRLSTALSGRSGTAVFLALQPGTTYVTDTVTGIAGGLNHPVYGALIVVR